MATLISGNPGSGKPTLTALLRSRGIHALDADMVPDFGGVDELSG
jgi:dephospho-CoA kinase